MKKYRKWLTCLFAFVLLAVCMVSQTVSVAAEAETETETGTETETETETGTEAKAEYEILADSELSAPGSVSVISVSNGLQLTWSTLTDTGSAGVDGYVVFRAEGREPDVWTTDDLVADSEDGISSDEGGTSCTYSDVDELTSGTVYYFAAAAYTISSETGCKQIGALSAAVSYMYLSEPEMKTASYTATGLKVTWESVDGANGYTVYRKTGSSGSWTALGSVTEAAYVDASAQAGKTYYYTVAAYSGSSASTYGNATIEGSGAYLSTPTLKTATAAATGTKISWGSVKNATGYIVLRKKSGGSWSQIGTTTSTSYTDTAALTGGTAYYYTVRAYAGSYDTVTGSGNKYKGCYWSDYDTTGVKSVYLAAPTLKSASAAASGTKISWSKVTGASGYAILRKKSGGSWSLIATTTSASYTDKSSLSGGATYYYTVRAYKGNASTAKSNQYTASYWGNYNTTGLKSVYLKNPTLKKATMSASGTKITWGKVTGASGYAVYRKKAGGSWSLITTTTSTSYTDKKSLSGGATYYYTVRAYKGSASTAKSNKYNAVYWSGYNTTGLKTVYLKNPTLKSAAVASSKYVKVTWSKVTGASGYAVYRKVSGGSWQLIGTTTSTSYTDKKALTSGKTYYYTVRAYKGSLSTAKANKYNAAYWSGYDSTGVKFNYIKNSDGTLVYDKTMYNKAQSKSSSTNWLILVDTTTCKVGVFYGSKGSWDMRYYWSCSPGKSSTPTVKGEFTVKAKGKSFGASSYTCWYYTQFYGNYLFHSVLYYPGSMTDVKDGRLGQNLSHGCVRMAIENAKWIYDNIPIGTKVYIY